MENPTHFIEVMKSDYFTMQGICYPISDLDSVLQITTDCEFTTIAIFKIKLKPKQ